MPALIVNHPDFDILAPTVDEAMTAARNNLRAHSIIESQREWTLLGSIHGIAAWGYAYEGGSFTREHHPMCGFLKHGPNQHACNCAQLA
jgi:hypothetical protein